MRRTPYEDLNPPPLREPSLRRALIVPGGLWTDLRVVAETGSTNSDVAAAARAGAAEGLVIIAESQTAGRGRLDRTWQSPARAGITLSALLRPGGAVATARLGWLALLSGVALAEAVGRVALVDTALKWPNDLLVRSGHGYGKCAGVLADVVSVANGGTTSFGVVLGLGLNVSQSADELPPSADPAAAPATSLTLAGAACTDRERLVRAILGALAARYGRWRAAGADPEASGLYDAYRDTCMTLGRDVMVTLPGDRIIQGRASDVDLEGRLVLRTADGDRAVSAGDVKHVR